VLIRQSFKAVRSCTQRSSRQKMWRKTRRWTRIQRDRRVWRVGGQKFMAWGSQSKRTQIHKLDKLNNRHLQSDILKVSCSQLLVREKGQQMGKLDKSMCQKSSSKLCESLMDKCLHWFQQHKGLYKDLSVSLKSMINQSQAWETWSKNDENEIFLQRVFCHRSNQFQRKMFTSNPSLLVANISSPSQLVT